MRSIKTIGESGLKALIRIARRLKKVETPWTFGTRQVKRKTIRAGGL